MDTASILGAYWRDIAEQNGKALEEYFLPDACIRWNNTNEQFTVEEFIVANCEYPGSWRGEVERIEIIGSTAVTAARVWSADNGLSFHVASFFELQGGKIASLDEYWGDDGAAPQWRLDKRIGRPIKRA